MKIGKIANQQDVRRLLLANSGGRVSVSDSVVRGLQLDRLPSGHATWRFRYREPVLGKHRCMRLGDAGVLPLAQARVLARQHALRVAMGEDPCAAKLAARLVPTFGAFALGAYLDSIKTRKRSWGTDVSLLKNHVLAVIGEIRLDLIRPVDIRLLVDGLIRKGHAPSTRNRVLILVRFIINCAMRWKVVHLPENPCSGIETLRENNRVERYLSREEAQRLQLALQDSLNPMLVPFVQLLLLTGCRRGEALNAKKQDFDLANVLWLLPLPKGGEARYVPLTQGAIHVVRHALALNEKAGPLALSSEYLFANPKTGQPMSSIHHLWNKARVQAGLKEVRMHDLRHSFASAMVNMGMTLYDVKEMLGHANIKTTERYAHLSRERLRTAAASVETFYGEQPWSSMP
jgi:integrase